MTTIERLYTVTAILMLAYGIGAILFLVTRAVVFKFVNRTVGGEISRYSVAVVLIYPAAVVYAFAIYPPAGVALLIPLVVVLVVPDITMAHRKADPSVVLPDKVKLTNPMRRVEHGFETRVSIAGEDWSAEFLEDGLAPPEPGDVVRIVERKGLKLIIARTRQY